AVLFQLFATLLLIMIAVLDIVEYKTWFIVTAALMVVFMTLLIIFSLQKRMKWRTREVLELAAMPVKDVKNGFTQRPKQVGRADYSDQELKDFARFIRRNMIAVPIHEPSRIVFVVNIPFKRLMLFKHQYEDRSWISFDDSGNVTASISQEDYMLYRDQFAFDQLCDSLGRLFIGFYEDYNAGRGQKVIDSFNKMNLNIITEG
ncbi:MAG TPA: hypothetical protein VK994_06780, partial [Bacteroidales bacterium]|nr:hypothetical protein [Bacteroidales bacterium]